MKRIILLLGAVFIGASAFAQKNHEIFKFENCGAAAAMDIRSLGSNPEFPSLRHLGSPAAVASAIKKTGMRSDRKGQELNTLLMETGFPNGASDVMASNITSSVIPAGTTGKMGNGTLGYQYVSMSTSNKAWKVTSNNGTSIYFFAACGNAFVPGTSGTAACAPKCKDVAVNVVSEPKEIIADAQASIVKQNTFIYYRKQCGTGNAKPLLVNSKDVAVVNPRIYKVTVTGDQSARVCNDGSTANVYTNINIENTGSYAGFRKTEMKGDYKLVSKKVYDRVEKKIRKAQKKVDKATGLAHTPVHI
jgi:hypothetical protein